MAIGYTNVNFPPIPPLSGPAECWDSWIQDPFPPQTCKKTIYLHKQGFIQNNFTSLKCVNCDQSIFAAKQRKI